MKIETSCQVKPHTLRRLIMVAIQIPMKCDCVNSKLSPVPHKLQHCLSPAPLHPVVQTCIQKPADLNQRICINTRAHLRPS